MKTKKIYLYVLGLGILTGGLIFGSQFIKNASAEEENLQYPVSELGNCKNKEVCKVYCDEPENISACVAFAEKNSLMTPDELKGAKKFIDAGAKGPGGCTGKDSCEAYCDDINHINECVAYAEKTGILPPKELKEAKQVQAAIARGINPPPCRGKKQCDAYCENPKNIKVCIAFGEAAGFLKGQELEDAKKMVTAVENGAIPPNCRGKEECDKYCREDGHMEECIKFAVAAGFMSEKDAEMAKKTGGKGPGGCRGKEECEAFCKNPDNEQICINFGKDNGLISPEELKQMEEGNKGFAEAVRNASPKTKKCLEEAFGNLNNVVPTRANGERMKVCFEKFAEEGVEKGQGPENQGMQRRTGPGGCNSGEACDIYCKENPEVCRSFQSPNENSFAPRKEIMPQQEQGSQPNPDQRNNAFREGMPLNQDLLINGTMPYSGTEEQIYSTGRMEGSGQQAPQEPIPQTGPFPMPGESSGEPVSIIPPGEFFLGLLANIFSAR